MNETLKSIQLDGHGNVVLQHVSAQGDIIINTLDWDTFVQRYTYQQQARIQELQKLLARSEELFDIKTLQLSQQINELQTEVARREAQVKHMIEEYADKDISQTDARYREAFELFLAGKLDEALALLDDAQLEAELRKAQEAQRRVAESYTLKADILQLQYDFAAAEDYLHRAYAAYPSWGNCLTLANFYKHLHQFPPAEQHYQQCLELTDDDSELATTLNNLAVLQYAKNEFAAAEQSYRRALDIREQLAEVNPQTYLPYVAGTLNNLGLLQYAKNEFAAAEQSYRRALDIREQLAEVNPQTYLPDVAMTLNNLAILQRAKNEFPGAEQSYRRALDIREQLARVNPQTYLPYVAGTLNNLGLLQKDKNEFPAAEQSYRRALDIREQLAEVNPQTYLPYVAGTLNNLGLLQYAKNEFAAAEQSYRRALDIREQLAEVNPQTYLPDVAMTLNNLAVLQKDKNEFPAAEQSYRRALDIRRAFAEAMPQAYDLPVCETSLNLVMFYFDKFQNGTEEDAQQFVALLTDVEIRLQRFPPDIPLVQQYWSYVHHYKQFLDEAGAA